MQLVTCNAGADCALRPQTNLVREVQLLTVKAATPHSQAGTNASWLFQQRAHVQT